MRNICNLSIILFRENCLFISNAKLVAVSTIRKKSNTTTIDNGNKYLLSDWMTTKNYCTLYHLKEPVVSNRILSLGLSHEILESYTHKIFHKMKPILADIIGLKNLIS